MALRSGNSDEETKRIASLESSDDRKRLDDSVSTVGGGHVHQHTQVPSSISSKGKQPRSLTASPLRGTKAAAAPSGGAAPKEDPLPELPLLDLAAARFSDEYTLNFDRPLGVGRNGAVIEAVHTNSGVARYVCSNGRT
jgi:hypothetical protein